MKQTLKVGKIMLSKKWTHRKRFWNTLLTLNDN